LVSGLWA